ncbi:MAG: hypothetical protein JRF61_08975 [Deltaproteobacteria bacterium]|nr:hypothetical protein [Deltaproteobacteria bacterium]
MLNRFALAVFVCSALIFGLHGSSAAVPIDAVNGATQLNVTSFGTLTDDLGVTVAAGGTAEVVSIPALPSPIVFYDVTAVDLDTAEIFHVGAVLDLTTTNTVTLSDFIIDAGQGQVFADVFSPSVDLEAAAVFNINKACSVADPCIGLDGTSTIEGLELTLTAAAAGVLETDLEIPNLTDAKIAVANSSFTLVPEPGTAVLGLTGLLILGLAARSPERAE